MKGNVKLLLDIFGEIQEKVSYLTTTTSKNILHFQGSFKAWL